MPPAEVDICARVTGQKAAREIIAGSASDALDVCLDRRAHPEPGLLVVRVGLQDLFQKLPRLCFASRASSGDGLLQ